MAKSRVVRNIEWTNNSKISNYWSQTLIFQIEKNPEISQFSNFQFGQKLQIWKIRKISNFRNSENLQFGKFKKIQLGSFKKFVIWKIKKI